ncbi:MAG: hypothetical protein A2X04_06130 [Bacteroidetes bacterium GWF2_41_9]|nr:MAG: hypothetical protein A2X04_06130 [Bacteroidetes bacterium GWF2_41_9]
MISTIEESPEETLHSGSAKITNTALNIFWTGFIIYSAGFSLAATGSVSFIVCQILETLGIILFFPSAIILIHFRFDNNYLKIIFLLYIGWLLSVIMRGIDLDYSKLKLLLFNAEHGIFLYFVPLALLFPRNLIYLKKVFKVIVVLGIIFILYDIIFLRNLLDLSQKNYNTKFTFEYFTKILSVPSGFILLTYAYHSRRMNLFAFLVIIVTVGFALIRARRALIFISFSPMLFAYFLYMYGGKLKVLIIILSLISGSFLFYIGLNIYNQNKYGAFALITNRFSVDTRSIVEEYFFQDMDTENWIIGKGIYGEYYCPGIDEGTYISSYRPMIETDYLNIILKGGIIRLGLLLLIAIPALILGIFNSNNLLSKAAGIWIFLWLLNLYPATVNTFSMNHILVWISIGICFSREIRTMPESSVKKILTDNHNE